MDGVLRDVSCGQRSRSGNMLLNLVVLMSQADDAWLPPTALAVREVSTHASSYPGPSYDRELVRITFDTEQLHGSPETVKLTMSWASYIPNPIRMPKSGVPLAENAIVHTNIISAAFPSIIATAMVSPRRKQGENYTRAPLPENVEEIAEAVIRERHARFIGSRLISLTSVTFDGQSVSRRNYPMTNTDYVPLRAFARAVGATIRRNDETLRFTLNRGNRVFQFAWGTPYAKMGSGWEKLPDGVALRDGQLWIPLVAAQRFVGRTD